MRAQKARVGGAAGASAPPPPPPPPPPAPAPAAPQAPPPPPSSRVIIKNLPPKADEAAVRAHLRALAADATDVKVTRTREGVSRGFAFVGFRDAALAERCVATLDRAFMGAVRLRVEPAREIGDDSLLRRALSRHSHAKVAAADEAAGAGARTGVGASADAGTGASSAPQPPQLPIGLAQSAKARVGEQNRDRLADYLALSRSRASVPTWADDDARARGEAIARPGRRAAAAKDADEATAAAAAANDGGSDSEEYDELPAAAAASKPKSRAKAAPAAPAAPESDLAYLRSKVVRGANFEDDDDGDGDDDGSREEETAAQGGGEVDDDDDEDEETEAGAALPAPAAKTMAKAKAGVKRRRPEEAETAPVPADVDANADEAEGAGEYDLAETGRLFVRNLAFACAEADVRAFFSRFGPLADVRVPVDAAGRHKGFAYVLFVVPEHAVRALAGADGRVLQGRILHVLPAAPAPSSGSGAGGGGGSGAGGGQGGGGFKAQKEARRRAGAGSEHEAAAVWNTLHVRSGTAVASAAEQLGVSREALLDRDASHMAVRVALTEAHAIAETKDFLRREGVRLPTLEEALVRQAVQAAAKAATAAATGGNASSAARKAAAAAAAVAAAKAAAATSSSSSSSSGGDVRSDTVILVKNLPFSADADALRELFGRHGQLLRLVLPPSRALALVEFADARAAKRAFAALAYARLQREPLYLEWAPEAVFEGPAGGAAAEAAAAGAAAASAAATAEAAAAAAAAATGQPRKRARGDDGGAVTAAAAASAAVAAAAADEDAAAGSAAAAAVAAAVAADGRTVFVKNLSFATTEEGLRALMMQAGALRAVRIPRRRNPKYKGPPADRDRGDKNQDVGASKARGGDAAPSEWQSMGYGFAEFAQREGAERALRTLQGALLDGHALQLKVSAPVGLGAASSTSAPAPSSSSSSSAAVPAGAAAAAAAAAASAASAARRGAAGPPPQPAQPAQAQGPLAPGLAAAAKAQSGKIVVRNLAFEATKAEVQQLFAGFGSVRSVRLPKKFDGSHRGFAFVDFLTHAEARAAMGALGATHLYGRKLVLEWAAVGDEADKGKGVAAL